MIGQKIADLRINKGWTQALLAEQTGISQSMIAKYEKNKAIPSAKRVQKIADAFGVALSTFGQITRTRHKEVERLPITKFQKLFKEAQTLPDEMQTRIMNYMSDLIKLRDCEDKNERLQNIFLSKQRH